MSKFIVTIDTDNAAFDDDEHGEVARILRQQVIPGLLDAQDTITLTDSNGNVVGEAKFTDDE